VRSLDVCAEHVDQMVAVLVHAVRSLSPSPDVSDSLQQIAQACVRDLADYCSIELLVDSSRGGPVCAAAGKEPSASSLQNAVVEPLTVGSHVFGTMTCATLAPGGFDDRARKAIRVLARQLTLVITGRLWLLRERSIADRIARTMLAQQLPAVAGVRLHGAYRPGTNDAGLGGDWFDAFTLLDGRIAMSVGDVAGRGLDAAVVMGEMRQAMRGEAAADASPASVLARLNAIVCANEPLGIVTAIFAVYDPATSTLLYSAAGHPPPLLVLANGFVRQLPTGGIPLGCSPDAEFDTWTFTLPASAHAVFYTDGMIATRRGTATGEERLLQAVRALARKRGGKARETDLAAELQRCVFGATQPRDDAALLLLSRSAPVASYTFSAVPVVAPIARAILEHEIAMLDLDADRRFGLVVAVGEAIANAVEHAYRGSAPGLIRLQVEYGAQELVVTVEDFGRWRRVVRRGEQRGRGIDLMHAFVDAVQIRKGRESTTIVLKSDLVSAAVLA